MSPYGQQKRRYAKFKDEFKIDIGIEADKNHALYLSYISYRIQLETLDEMAKINTSVLELKGTLAFMLLEIQALAKKQR